MPKQVTVGAHKHEQNMHAFELSIDILFCDQWTLEEGKQFEEWICTKYDLESYDHYHVDPELDLPSDYDMDCKTLGHTF